MLFFIPLYFFEIPKDFFYKYSVNKTALHFLSFTFMYTLDSIRSCYVYERFFLLVVKMYFSYRFTLKKIIIMLIRTPRCEFEGGTERQTCR